MDAGSFDSSAPGPAGFTNMIHPGTALPSPGSRWLESLKLELAFLSGRAWLASRQAAGAGAILRFVRVRPRRNDSFQPLAADEITPDFLDRLIVALKRWGYDIVAMDEACERAVQLALPRR